MRLLFIIIAGVFLVTYAWGWLVHVPDGPMTTRSYTRYYLGETKEQMIFFMDEAAKLVQFAKKPLPRAREFEL